MCGQNKEPAKVVANDKRFPERDTGHVADGATWFTVLDKLESLGNITPASLP